MRRWNGWGDEAINLDLNPEAGRFLQDKVGQPAAPQDATLEQVCQQVPAARIGAHPLIDRRAEVRIRHSLGQSLPDWLQMRYGHIAAVPDGVAFPESSEQVGELLRYARQHKLIVIPYGGGTSVVGHLSVPSEARPVLSLSLKKMSQLISLDPNAQLATFGAGILGPDLEAQLRARGYTLGHFPQSFEYSSLGGWVVTRSSGQQSLRYGRIEQLFAGGRVETPIGMLDIPAFPASAAGTDLRELLLGSEGRIGILTEVTVRISRLPEQEAFHALFFPDWQSAQSAMREMVQLRLPVSMLRLSNPVETETTLAMAGHAGMIRWLERYLRWRGVGQQKCLLLAGASGNPMHVAYVQRSVRKISAAFGGVSAGSRIGEKWKHGRFRNVYLRNTLWQRGYAIDTVETACDWGQTSTMMAAIEQAARSSLAEAGERVHCYTHLSHVYQQGASVYSSFVYRLSGDFETDMRRWRALKAAVSAAIVAHGGTISHQHGVGTDHAPYLLAEKGHLGMSALRHLYQHFDPDGMMNPGKLISAAEPA